jgi:hypothetical protein
MRMFSFLRRKKVVAPPTEITPVQFIRDGYEQQVTNGVVVVWWKDVRVKTVTPYLDWNGKYYVVYMVNEDKNKTVWHTSETLKVVYVPAGVDPDTLPAPLYPLPSIGMK